MTSTGLGSRRARSMTMAVASLLLAGFSAHAAPVTGRSAPSEATERADAFTILQIAGRSSANPSVAIRDRFAVVTWSAATLSSMDIYAAVSRDGGRSFGAPVQVNATPGEARVSGENPPRVALVPQRSGDPAIVIVWTAKRGARTALLWARSRDGGRSFGASAEVPGSDGEGARGWASVAVDGRGRVGVLWLDHRRLPPMPMTHAAGGSHVDAKADAQAPSAPAADPTARAGYSDLRLAWLSDADRPADSQVLASSVCYCCKTTFIANGARVAAAWRHVYPGSYRDMAFAESRDGGRHFSVPLRVSEDHWQLDGCPDNGPTMGMDAANRAVVVWPAPADGQTTSALTLFAAVKQPDGRFGGRVALPTKGPAGHVQLVVTAPGTAMVLWDEVVRGARQLGAAAVRFDGTGVPRVAAVAPPVSGEGHWYPSLAGSGRSLLAAWVRQSPGGTVIGVAPLPERQSGR